MTNELVGTGGGAPGQSDFSAHHEQGGVGVEQIESELVQLARLTEAQIAAVHEEQRRSGASFVEAMIALNLMSREKLMSALSKRYNYPILHPAGEGRNFSRSLVVGYEPFGPSAEQFRSIRAALVATGVDSGAVRSIAIIAPRENVGASYCAANLALAFAQMSVVTLLVDANLRRPSIGPVFGFAPGSEGLSEMLQNGLRRSAIHRNVISGLSVLTAGAPPPNPQELLSGESFFRLASQLDQEFGVVIYDSPPAMESFDAFVLASRCNAAVIVARKNETKFEELAVIKEKLRMTACKIVGSILNEH